MMLIVMLMLIMMLMTKIKIDIGGAAVARAGDQLLPPKLPPPRNSSFLRQMMIMVMIMMKMVMIMVMIMMMVMTIVMMMVMMIITIISPRDPIAILKCIGNTSANFPENVPVLGFMHFASLLLIIEISFEQS